MSINHIYAFFGAFTGISLGFLTRDDYLYSSDAKMKDLSTQYYSKVKDADEMLREEIKKNQMLQVRVEELRGELAKQKKDK
jgi:hypothetical protein